MNNIHNSIDFFRDIFTATIRKSFQEWPLVPRERQKIIQKEVKRARGILSHVITLEGNDADYLREFLLDAYIANKAGKMQGVMSALNAWLKVFERRVEL